MADTKLSVLAELAAKPATNDELYIRDESEAPAAESKRITIANLMLAAGGIIMVAANDATDAEKAAALASGGAVSSGTNDEVDWEAVD